MRVSRKSASVYRKSIAVKDLEKMAIQAARIKHPTCPHLAPRVFRDDTANALTKCIVQYITLRCGFASRVNNQGTYRTSLGRYIPSTSRRGLADIIGTYNGMSLHVEVKVGKDRQSQHQKAVESEVTNSGGHYFLAKNFTDFKAWFDGLSKEGNAKTFDRNIASENNERKRKEVKDEL